MRSTFKLRPPGSCRSFCGLRAGGCLFSFRRFLSHLPIRPISRPFSPLACFSFLSPLLLLCLLFLFLLLPLAGCSAPAAPPAPYEEHAAAVPVSVFYAYRGDIQAALSFPGVLEAKVSVNVAPKIGGKVAEVRVKNGSFVEAGELLLRLDASELSAQLAQAEAALQLALVQYEAAARSLEDTRALFEEEIVSRQQFEQVETQYKMAAAQLAQAEAALQLVRIQINNSSLYAPLAGVVSGLKVNPGEMLSPGVPVLTINQMEAMHLRLSLTEKDVGRLFVGQKVQAFVPAVSAEPLTGEIIFLSPVADPVTKTFEAKVELPNEGLRLKAGMSATLRAVVEEEKDAVVIPVEAVLTEQGRHAVYVVEGGSARLRPVTLGLKSGNKVAVRQGIEPGEQVVIKGQHYLSDDAAVSIAERLDEASAPGRAEIPEREEVAQP